MSIALGGLGLCLLAPSVSLAAFSPEHTPAAAADGPHHKHKLRERTQGNAGLGLTLGDPSGFSFKYFARPAHAIQLELAYGPIHYHAGRLGMDYLWHPGTFVSNEKLDLVPYLGVGIGFAIWPFQGAGDIRDDRVHFGPFLRAPVLGLAIHLKRKPVDLALEGAWSPMWDVRTAFLLAVGDVSFKFRWYI